MVGGGKSSGNRRESLFQGLHRLDTINRNLSPKLSECLLSSTQVKSINFKRVKNGVVGGGKSCDNSRRYGTMRPLPRGRISVPELYVGSDFFSLSLSFSTLYLTLLFLYQRLEEWVSGVGVGVGGGGALFNRHQIHN